MDLMALLSQLADAGIGDLVTVVIVVLFVRYSAGETRREISKEIDDKVGSAKSDLEALIKENRQEIAAVRTETRQEIHALRTETRQDFEAVRKEMRQDFEAVRKETRQEIHALRTETRQEFDAARANSEQSHKEIMLHLIDVRERLANIEGRLGAPTTRMSGVSPPLEAPAEEPSAQS